MIPEKKARHSVDFLFPLLLFLVFTASALILVLFGSEIYRSVATDMESNYTSRTALAYVTEKLRQSDEIDAITIADVEDHTALVLKKTVKSKDYVTYIYQSNGKLRELYVKADTEVSAAQGTALTDADDFIIEETGNGFFRVSITEGGETLWKLIHAPACS